MPRRADTSEPRGLLLSAAMPQRSSGMPPTAATGVRYPGGSTRFLQRSGPRRCRRGTARSLSMAAAAARWGEFGTADDALRDGGERRADRPRRKFAGDDRTPERYT